MGAGEGLVLTFTHNTHVRIRAQQRSPPPPIQPPQVSVGQVCGSGVGRCGGRCVGWGGARWVS